MKTSKTWYAEWCADGQRYYERLGTTNKASAVKSTHRVVQRIESGQPNPRTRRVTLKEAVSDNMGMLRDRGRAPKTLEKYGAVLNTLAEWFDARGMRRANAFDERSLWGFNNKMAEDGLAEKTRYDRLVIVKQLFKWAARTKLIATNALAGIQMDKPSSSIQPCFLPEQVAQLLERADPHEGAIFSVMAYAGLRFGEVRDLCWSDVLLDQGESGFIVVRRGGSAGATKTGRIRRIPVYPKLHDVLDRLPRTQDRVFSARPSKKYPEGTGPIDERRLLASLKRLCRRCGYKDPNQYKLHTFRHAFSSMCARNNISYKCALEWMGHRSSDILDLYYAMFDDTAEAAMRTIEYRLHSEITPATGR